MSSELFVQTIKGPTSGANANKVIIPSGQTLDASSGAVTGIDGVILQILSVEENTSTTITSSSHTNTAVTLSITPSATSSKILVLGSIQVMSYKNGSPGSSDGYYRIRNTTNSTQSTSYYIQNHDYGSSGTIQDASRSMQWLDTPNSTASQTYVIQMRKTSGDAIVSNNGGYSSLTLMEIAG